MRTNAPSFPSGRRLGSTSHSPGSIAGSWMPRWVSIASRVAMSTARPALRSADSTPSVT